MKQYTITIAFVVEAKNKEDATEIADRAVDDCRAYSCADHAYIASIEKEDEED